MKILHSLFTFALDLSYNNLSLYSFILLQMIQLYCSSSEQKQDNLRQKEAFQHHNLA